MLSKMASAALLIFAAAGCFAADYSADFADRWAADHECGKILQAALPPKRAALLVVNGRKVKTVWVRTVDTEDTRENGLMCRRLDSDEGMLFAFDKPEASGVWMYQTYIPLTIAFLDEERRVIDLTRQEPCVLGTGESNVEWMNRCHHRLYKPKSPNKYMLEVLPGLADEAGIKIGDQLSFEWTRGDESHPASKTRKAIEGSAVAPRFDGR